MKRVVITINRQYGSGGKTIGYMLAEKLGIPCYSREILQRASEESGINESMFNARDERLKRLPKFPLSTNVYSGELLPPWKAKNLHQIRISLTTKLRLLKNTQQKVLAY